MILSNFQKHRNSYARVRLNFLLESNLVVYHAQYFQLIRICGRRIICQKGIILQLQKICLKHGLRFGQKEVGNQRKVLEGKRCLDRSNISCAAIFLLDLPLASKSLELQLLVLIPSVSLFSLQWGIMIVSRMVADAASNGHFSYWRLQVPAH